MTDSFFSGTLMSGFERPGRSRVDRKLTPEGRCWIHATLFDLYNAPLGRAQRIESGDYLEHLKVK